MYTVRAVIYKYPNEKDATEGERQVTRQFSRKEDADEARRRLSRALAGNPMGGNGRKVVEDLFGVYGHPMRLN